MADKKDFNINDLLDLAEKHNTMGQFVQQKLHEFRTEKRKTFDQVSYERIISFLDECKGIGVEGAEALLQAVKNAPVIKE